MLLIFRAAPIFIMKCGLLYGTTLERLHTCRRISKTHVAFDLLYYFDILKD